MKTVRSKVSNYFSILPDQIENEQINYVPHKYIIRGGENVLNCITGEIVKDISLENDRSELIRKWFLIPENVDPASFLYLMRQIRLPKLVSLPITDYTIFTTMQCNARCPYCFQEGKHNDKYMSEQTAVDIANYIKQKSDLTKRLYLHWFGGEPLLNQKAMNLICDSLRGSNVIYTSYLTSNGDLFPTVSDKDIFFWNLKTVQFSLDYPDEKYEETKKLPSGAYSRLKDTVARLDDLKVYKRLRVHYHPETGMEPIYKIIDDFKDSKFTSIYIAFLCGEKVSKKDFDDVLKAEDLLASYGKLGDPIPTSGKPSHCMADNHTSRTITVDGGLSPCEHYSYEENYGTIYSDVFDKKVLERWSSKRKYDLKCVDCPLFPTCELLSCCPAIAKCEHDYGYGHYITERVKRAVSKIGV